VRIGEEVPYVMVEARLKADPFDAGIPREGVIVYAVQTPDPLGHRVDKLRPVILKAPQTAPTKTYWLEDRLRRGGTSACVVSSSSGNECERLRGNPMRVCKSSQPDPEGNACNWKDCRFEADAGPHEFFGGCGGSGGSTAGTLCCPDGAPASACTGGRNSAVVSS
jgi:hypothetical protein